MPTEQLTSRHPEISPDELISTLVPPPRFDSVRFSTYVPNPAEPSQAEAVAACSRFAERVADSGGGTAKGWRALFGLGGRKQPAQRPGLYLDGGFGVGKRSEEHTSELQSRENLVCRLLI